MQTNELTPEDRELLTNFDLIPGVDIKLCPQLGPDNRRVFLVSVPVEQPENSTQYWPTNDVRNLVAASNRWKHGRPVLAVKDLQ